MKVSDSTIRFRTRPDDRALYLGAAMKDEVLLSEWLRKTCNRAAKGLVQDSGIRRDLIKLRMKLNRIADLDDNPATLAAVHDALQLIDGRLGGLAR